MNTTNKRSFGTHEVARICQVTPPTVGRWIVERKLACFTTGGGHRRVWDTDLLAFLRAHNIPVPPDLAPAGRIKILIVDDEKLIRKTLKRAVGQARPTAEIREAVDGFEAGHAIATWRPTLILLDIYLPGISGIKICETVRADPDLRGIKILAISGDHMSKDGKDVRDAGADDFLPKPFDIDDLIQRVIALLPVESGRDALSGDR